MKKIIDTILSFALGLFLAFILSFFAGGARVSGQSMDPTLKNNNLTIVSKASYFFATPERGDIISFRYFKDKERIFVKRVIGIPGDVVNIYNNEVYVNGEKIVEDYLKRPMYTRNTGDIHVYPGEYFVLGDNRNVSFDSRDFGKIRESDILGKVLK